MRIALIQLMTAQPVHQRDQSRHWVQCLMRICDVALRAGHREKRRDRAAPSNLHHVAHVRG